MSLRKILLFAAVCSLHALVAHADTERDDALRAQLKRIAELREERAGDGLLVFYQAMTEAQLGQREAALTDLKSLLGRKLGLVPAEGEGFDSLWKDAEFQRLRDQLSADEAVTSPPAKVLARLKDKFLLPEGIAHDAATGRYFIGSIHQRKIVVVEPFGRVRDWSRKGVGLDAILGLFVDAPRRLLWAVSTNGFETESEHTRRNAVLAFDLANGRLRHRIELPQAAQLNDLAVAADGTVFVTDTLGSAVWRLAPQAKLAQKLGEGKMLRGANGIAISSQGKLYVATSTGIALLDAASGAARRMQQPDEVVSGGIDGLYYHGGELIGIQNGPNPGRVIALKLSPDGARIQSMRVLQSHHHPAFNEPTTGTIVGENLVLIANSHIASRQPDGRIERAEKLRPTVLLQVPLLAAQ